MTRRKQRIGEVVCTCDAYRFPHRFTGGACTGRYVADDYFFGGSCRDCKYLTDNDGYRDCQIISGAESVTECPIWQDKIREHDVRLLGPRYRNV